MRIFALCVKLQIGDLFDIVKGNLSAVKSRLAQLAFAVLKNLDVSAIEFISWSNISNSTMKSYQVVMIHKFCDDTPGLSQRCGGFGSDALSFERSIPALQFSVGLRIERRGSHMGHAAKPDEHLEFSGDELGSIVRNDPGVDAGKAFPGSLNDDFHIRFCHLFADLPVNDVSAIPIQQRT